MGFISNLFFLDLNNFTVIFLCWEFFSRFSDCTHQKYREKLVENGIYFSLFFFAYLCATQRTKKVEKNKN
jgi:hypothetical protein